MPTPTSRRAEAASAAVRRWPLDRFAAVLERLAGRKDLAIIVVNAPNEPALFPKEGVIEQRAHSCGSLEELFALTEEVDRVLCHDSLMAHLGAALGKPVHTLFGPQNPNWFAPQGNRERVLVHEACPHRPCFDRCVFSSPRCMEAIQVEEVVAVFGF